MPARASSPALPEQGFDITDALARSEEDHSEYGSSNLPNSSNVNETRRLEQESPHSSDGSGDEEFIFAQQAASKRKASVTRTKSDKKSGGFQSMGLNVALLKAITRKGFSVPTPIQRKTIPPILDQQDVVGMARTGSGKTAAFVIPMIEKLKTHSVKIGARALILSPSRELAIQTMIAVKEFGRGTDLKSILLVGGDNLEEQFFQMMSNPDIIIATPGRFMHLLVEMKLDLSSISYVVFDEADRLFEMGFGTQLNEILHGLPPSRQTLLFSATLPSSLVEFAKAGLKDPNLIRLDAEMKISPDLQSAFLALKSAEKEGALLHILSDVIKIPMGAAQKVKHSSNIKKRKRETRPDTNDSPTAFSTAIFTATKHHVEYLAGLLRGAGFAVSYVYGSLDQTNRQIQVERFRNGITSILITTDVAARGIDIPILANVINYDFSRQPKMFIHRVGRTARAGKKGWSYNLVKDADLPYLLDLQLFLGRRLITSRKDVEPSSFAQDIVVGSISRSKLEPYCEWAGKLVASSEDLVAQRSISVKGEKLYLRSCKSASLESAKRAKNVSQNRGLQEVHAIYPEGDGSERVELNHMLSQISGFRPQETVFEIGRHGQASTTADIIKRQRVKFNHKKVKHRREESGDEYAKASQAVAKGSVPASINQELEGEGPDSGSHPSLGNTVETRMDDQQNGEAEVEEPHSARLSEPSGHWQDDDNFMPYQPRGTNIAEDRGFGVQSGSAGSKRVGFADAARRAVMDMGADDSRAFGEPSRARQMRWDRKSKKYVAIGNDDDNSKKPKTIQTASGQRVAASFRNGKFDEWKKRNRLGDLPRIGENENPRQSIQHRSPHRTFKYTGDKVPKQPDKFRDDFHKQKKKFEEAKARANDNPQPKSRKNELRSIDDVRRQRLLKQRRKDKNARPPRRRKT